MQCPSPRSATARTGVSGELARMTESAVFPSGAGIRRERIRTEGERFSH